MWVGDLNAAAAKLAKQQAERAERERQRLAKERALAERQRQRQALREEEARTKRLEAIAAAAAEEERRQADLEENRGVELRVRLSAAPAAPGDAAARGIRRAADKLVLPPSVGEALLAQGAPRNGAMLFEVAAPNGGVTHAGVLEFAAPEGVVLLPSKVSDCLWGQSSASGGGMDDATAGPGPNSAGAAAATAPRCSGPVWVRYKRLPKGTYVRFQPALRAFHEEVGNDAEQLRSALEACLLGYCTLSEGDWVQVEHGGKEYALRVLELQPAAAVSVIDTEMAADVGPSIETEGYLRAREEEAAREAERQRQQQETAMREAAEAAATQEAAARARAEREAEETARRLALRAAAAERVAPEPPTNAPGGAATLVFRLPDGARISRRFALCQTVTELRDFVDSEGAGGLPPGSYELVASFPRRLLLDRDATLEQVGLAAGEQVALFLEQTTGADAPGVA